MSLSAFFFTFLNLRTSPLPPRRALSLLPQPGLSSVPLPSVDAAQLRRVGCPRGSSTLPCNQSERSLLSIAGQNLCNTLHCCCRASEQRTRAGINPGLSHGNGNITSGPTPEDFILLRHRGHASLHSASLSIPSSSNKGIAKELKKLSPVNTQAEALVKLHLAPETCWVKLLGVGKSV